MLMGGSEADGKQTWSTPGGMVTWLTAGDGLRRSRTQLGVNGSVSGKPWQCNSSGLSWNFHAALVFTLLVALHLTRVLF